MRDDDRELVAAEPREEVLLRSTPSSRLATSCSSMSPIRWPSVSLTTLKRSRSRNITAKSAASPGERLS